MKAFSFFFLVCIATCMTGCDASKEQLRSTQADLDRTKARLAAADAEIATLKNDLATSKAQIAELTPWATKARTLPVRLSAAPTASNTNGSYQLVNLSSVPLAIRIHLMNTNSQRTMTLTRVLPATRLAAGSEIGVSDGWSSAGGDVLEMTSEGFDVLTKRF